MIYCLGLYLEEGLVLLSDTRTSAGVDNDSTYCKMHHFQEDDERDDRPTLFRQPNGDTGRSS